MNLSSILRPGEFRIIRTPLLLFVAASLLGGALFWIGNWYHADAERKLLDLKAEISRLESTAEAAEVAKNDWQHFSHLYDQFVADGFVGEEDRLQWVETLTGIQHNNPALQLNWVIAPQTAFDLGGQPGVLLTLSPMSVNFRPLHEVEMQRVLDDIHHGARGGFNIRTCKITRPDAARDVGEGSRLKVECTLDWYSARIGDVPAVATQ